MRSMTSVGRTVTLNPHVHAVLLDGVAHDPDTNGEGGELAFETLQHAGWKAAER